MAEQRTVHSRVKKRDDIEIHVSTIATEHGTYLDIREYVVSLGQYGRGLTAPARNEIVDSIETGLLEIKHPVP